jgi:hypothetical protein
MHVFKFLSSWLKVTTSSFVRDQVETEDQLSITIDATGLYAVSLPANFRDTEQQATMNSAKSDA